MSINGDPFIDFVRSCILPNKQKFSQELAAKFPLNRSPLPRLGQAGTDGRVSMSTIESVNAQCAQLRYNADPLWGLSDFYNHPEYTEWMRKYNQWKDPCDCDDFAVYAVALLHKCGINHSKAWIWNLLVDPPSQVTQAWANHVIAGVEYWDGQKIWTAIIDTNSAKQGRPYWFQGDKIAVQSSVIQHFRDIYKVNYYTLITVPFPFPV